MKKILIVLICLSLYQNQFAQDNVIENNKKKIGDAVYFQDLINLASDKPSLSRIDVFIQVPTKVLQQNIPLQPLYLIVLRNS